VRSVVFWDVTQRIVVIPYRRFGTTVRTHLETYTASYRRRVQISWNERLGKDIWTWNWPIYTTDIL